MKSTYRGLLRELSRSAPVRKDTVKKAPAVRLRRMIETSTISQEAAVVRAIEDATTYLKNQREYLELLRRYNPLHDMTSEEHLDVTVRHVGLQLPEEIKCDSKRPH